MVCIPKAFIRLMVAGKASQQTSPWPSRHACLTAFVTIG
jgi:hypothetical protein